MRGDWSRTMSDTEQTQAEEEFSSSQFTELREAYKTAKKELKELRAYREASEPKVRRAALREAGFDPDSPQAKALLKLHDGDMDAGALKATADEYGISFASEEAADRGETRARDWMDERRGTRREG
jgi:3-methyladenine DNA glycosylase AlkC